MEDSKGYVHKNFIARMLENMGVDLSNKIDSLDDFQLLALNNHCVSEYSECSDIIYTSLEELVNDTNPRDPLEFARAICEGDCNACFNPDNWVYIEACHQICVLTADTRRNFLYGSICGFNPENTKKALKELGLL